MSKVTRKFVFTPLDIVAPWGICLTTAVLCGLGAFYGKPLGTDSPWVFKTICVIVGLAFLGGIPLWYWYRGKVRTPTFITQDGIAVIWGKVHQPPCSMVEDWTSELKTDWTGYAWKKGEVTVSLLPSEINATLKTITAFFVDKEEMTIWGRLVRGYAQDSGDIVIGLKDPKPLNNKLEWHPPYTRKLYRHEVSHPLLGVREPWEEDRHHNVFKEIGLNA